MNAWIGRLSRQAHIGSLVALLVLLRCAGGDGSADDEPTEDDVIDDLVREGDDSPVRSPSRTPAEDSSEQATPDEGEGSPPAPRSNNPDCSNQLSGESCSGGASCSWVDSANCIEGECSCVSGRYACYSRTSSSCNDPGAVCPDSRETSCGSSCEGTVNNCLCRCGGGGPNYSSCSCSGGTWSCLSCQGG